MKKQLESYYNEKGISPLNFNCRHYNSCISKVKNKKKFANGLGIWIGAEYEKGNLPRLLFLSLDRRAAPLRPNERTMEAAKEWNLNWLPGKMDKPKHWYRTQQFAWHVFNEFNNTFNTALDIGMVDEKYDFKPVTEIHKIKPFYAATNSLKCCVNNEDFSQANGKLFENCREYILGEIVILNPEILVTQGKPARLVVESMQGKIILHSENISGASRTEDDYHIIKTNTGKLIVWIHHYHPRCFGIFRKNRNKYELYSQKAVKAIKEHMGKKI